MTTTDKTLTISVRESLIPGLVDMSGPVLLYVTDLQVEDGFALASDEFVTSVAALTSALSMAGIPDGFFARMSERV